MQLVAVRLQALGDVAVEDLLHVQEALHQLLILLGQLFVLPAEVFDAVSLLVVAHCANVGGDEENRPGERRLEAQQQVEEDIRWRIKPAGELERVVDEPEEEEAYLPAQELPRANKGRDLFG